MKKGVHPSVRFDTTLGYEVKRCTRCREEKPLAYFYTRPGGWHAPCKACEIAAKKAREAANPEKYRADWRGYHAIHREARNAQSKQWREENPERYRAYYTAYAEMHREELRARARQRHAKETPEFRAMWYQRRRPYFQRWGVENREHIYQNALIWRAANRQRYNDKEGRRRARKLNAPVVERVDRDAIIARDNGICYLCGITPTGRNLTLDHVIPLFRGGSHTAANLRVCCWPCNARKGTRLLDALSS